MVLIAGAGISGLSVAYFLHKAGMPYMLVEQSAQAGGCIKTVFQDSCRLELGPNSLPCDNFLNEFIAELELQEEVLPSAPLNKHRFIYRNGRYRRLPSGPLSLFFGNFFSLQTKLKIIKELFRSPGDGQTNTLKDFFTDHFGEEVATYALDPFVFGIYAGNPAKLLLEETFPSLKRFEAESGSVLKGLIKNAGARKKLIGFKGGMQALTDKLASLLDIRYSTSLADIRKTSTGFEVKLCCDGNVEQVKAASVVLSLPAASGAGILTQNYPQFAQALSQVHCPPMAIVHSSYRREDVAHRLQGFGGLNPKAENRFSAGSIWNTSVFPTSAPSGTVLFTSFAGGVMYEDNARLPEDVVKKNVHEELKESFGILGQPLFQKYTLWQHSIPQYDENIVEVKKQAAKLEEQGLFLCSNVLNGVSVGDCIKKGKRLAEKIESQLR